MSRAGPWCFFLVVLSGCQTPERAAIQPLREEGKPIPYPDLVLRAHSQVSAAQEFFFQDSWSEVEQAADALEQTARLLGKLEPAEIPAPLKEGFPRHLEELTRAVADLHAAAKTRDIQASSEAFRKINVKVREIRVPSPNPADRLDGQPRGR